MKQMEIEGIGQQKAKLSNWKKESNVFTYCSPYMEEDKWSCWSGTEDLSEFINKHGYEDMAIGNSEKSVIIKYCLNNGITLPFWY